MFGQRIIELRKQQGLTQLELAKAIGISRSALSLYEIEKREPDIDTLIKLSSSFNVSVGYIIGSECHIKPVNYTIDTSCATLNFITHIHDLMTDQKMSEQDFMQKTGFSQEDTNAYLHGNRIPTIDGLIKIASALNVSIDYLLNVSDRKRLTEKEEALLRNFNRCNDECQQYLLAKAGVLCVEGISAASGEHGKYTDNEKELFPSSGLKEMEA